jgi:ABC-type antimicrobial peptide transport system permease subunit
MALGARPGDVIRNVMVQGIGLALSGVALGIITALAVGRLLLTLLYKVRAIDPTTFAAVAIAALGVAALACYVTARRAITVDPMTTRRAE